MKHGKSFKLFYLSCVGLICASMPSHAFLWPTFDIAEVTNTINGMSSQVDSVSSTAKSMTSTTEMQQALGDNVGSVSKFTNKDEDDKKKQEKAEKRRKRAEWIDKKKRQVKAAKKSATEYSEKGKDLYAKGKDAYDKGSEYADQAKDYYDQGMSYLDEMNGKGASEENEAAAEEENNTSANDNAPAFDTAETAANDVPPVKPAVTSPQEDSSYQVYDIDETALDNQAIADLVADEEFSEGAWMGEGEQTTSTPVLQKGEVLNRTDNALSTENVQQLNTAPNVENSPNFESGKVFNRRPFVRDNSVELKNSAPESSKETMRLNDKKLEVGQSVSTESVPNLSPAALPAKAVSNVPASSSKARVFQRLQTKSAVLEKADTTKAVAERSITANRAVSAEVLKNNGNVAAPAPQNRAVKKAIAPKTLEVPNRALTTAVEKQPEVSRDKISVQETTSGARKAFKTLKVSYRVNTPLAFAQEASGDFKTGTNDDGKFIYSDILADKCDMNYDAVTDEKVAECIKIFVMGMNHENAETAAEWKKQYNKARHDHAASDLSVAINQKAFSASFDTKVAEDLESKSEALTTEREEVAFSGKVNQTNQEIIIRLMESLTAQAMTDALNAIEGMDADYYKDQEE